MALCLPSLSISDPPAAAAYLRAIAMARHGHARPRAVSHTPQRQTRVPLLGGPGEQRQPALDARRVERKPLVPPPRVPEGTESQKKEKSTVTESNIQKKVRDNDGIHDNMQNEIVCKGPLKSQARIKEPRAHKIRPSECAPKVVNQTLRGIHIDHDRIAQLSDRVLHAKQQTRHKSDRRRRMVRGRWE